MPSANEHLGPRPGGERRIRASTPDDGPAIVALMKEVGLEPQAQQPEYLDWKYWGERADWPGSRSYVLTDGKDIVAHGAVVPGVCHWGGSRRQVIHMIDWAARRGAIGAGVLLMKHVGRHADLLLGIGGSDDTLKILPLIGYRPRGVVTGFVRALSPVGLLKRERANPSWRLIPRLARSTLWSLTAPPGKTNGWQSRRLAMSEVGRIAGVLPVGRPGLVVCERSEALFRHLLACPIVPVELYMLEKAGRAGGYFLLSYAPGQARLADAWMESEDPADWRALIHSAVRQAKRRADSAELVAWASDPLLSQSLEQCGFHQRRRLPIYLRGSDGLPESNEVVRVQMVDNDSFYLCLGRSELWA